MLSDLSWDLSMTVDYFRKMRRYVILHSKDPKWTFSAPNKRNNQGDVFGALVGKRLIPVDRVADPDPIPPTPPSVRLPSLHLGPMKLYAEPVRISLAHYMRYVCTQLSMKQTSTWSTALSSYDLMVFDDGAATLAPRANATHLATPTLARPHGDPYRVRRNGWNPTLGGFHQHHFHMQPVA